MLEKTTRVNFLFDFYQSLLTDKQRLYMQLYYLDDLSLGEIAEQYSVSRQAVYDNVKRTEAMLEDYEKKLNLFEKHENRLEVVEKLQQILPTNDPSFAQVQELLHTLKDFE
ncbi:putative DNA-binding protein [Sporosarcina sp. GW1-11]|uniref:putative DNA-binding protein n=1 Tax=Sporosarcina sp. GW1-11 TaxID=2899126 RepID=UPI00294EC213|nr:putative DNA-binding protein [Sporosarcina sp. GW1-11]MDV6376743.1 putative DNA-binding protein [Sporosarcina sp. GW1-11]